MPEELGSASFGIDADISDFEKKLAEAKAEAAAFAKSTNDDLGKVKVGVSGLNTTMSALNRTLNGASADGARRWKTDAGGLGAVTRQAKSMNVEISKLNKELSMADTTTKTFGDRFLGVFGRSKASVDDLRDSLTMTQSRLVELQNVAAKQIRMGLHDEANDTLIAMKGLGGEIDAVRSKAERLSYVAAGGGGGGGFVPIGGGGGGGGGGRFINMSGGGGGGYPWRNLWWNRGGGRFMPWGLGWLGAGGFGGAHMLGLSPEHLVGVGLGVAGSAAGAIGGGATLGLGALGSMAVGGGSDLAVMKSTIADTQTLYKSYTNLQQAIQTYGANSKAAAQAQAQLNYQMQALGPAAKVELSLAKQVDKLNTLWDQMSAPARGFAVKILEQVVQLGRAFLPKVTQAAKENLSIINTSLKPLFSWLKGPNGMKIWDDLESHFRKDLPVAMDAFRNGVELLLKVIDYANSKLTGKFLANVDRYFKTWNQFFGSGNKKWDLQGKIDKMVGDFHLWMTLLKEIGNDLRLLFKAGANEGNTFLGWLTQVLKKWGEWEGSAKGQQWLHTFFYNRMQEMKAVLNLLGAVARPLAAIYATVQPLVPVVTAIANGIAGALNDIVDLGKQGGIAGKALQLGLGAFLVSWKAAGFGKTVGALRSLVNMVSGGRLGRLRAAAGAAAASGEGGGGVLSKVLGAGDTAGQVWGARGNPYRPGSLLNPIAVIVVDNSSVPGAKSPAENVGKEGEGALATLGMDTPTLLASSGIALPLVLAGLFSTNYNGQLSKGVQGLSQLTSVPNSVQSELYNGSAVYGGKHGAEPWTPQMVALINQANAALKQFYSTGNTAGIQRVIDKADQLKQEWPQQSKALTDLAKVMDGVTHTTLPAVSSAFSATQSASGRSLAQINDAVNSSSKQIQAALGVGSANANKALAENFILGAKDVAASMKSGVVSTQKGITEIAKMLADALKTLGVSSTLASSLGKGAATGNAAAALNVGAIVAAGGLNFGTGSGNIAGGLAHGGYVGNVGERGPDNVGITVGRGEAVLNYGQQAVVNSALAMAGMGGGLRELFTRYAAPHAMARGGFAGGGVVSYSGLESLWTSAGGNPSMAALMAAIAEAESGGNPLARNPSGASGLWQILGLPFAGNVWNPLTNARMAVSKFNSQGLGAWTTYTSGAYRQFLNGAGGAASAMGLSLPSIKTPRVRGTGAVAALARGALGKVAGAANQFLQSQTAALGSVSGGIPFHHGKFVFPLPTGSWRAEEVDQGWDLAAPGNTPLYAIGAGTIVGHGISGFGPWAPVLKLNDGGEVYYGHAGPAGELPIGTRVRAGQVIGTVGPGIVGNSTGPHLEIGFYPPGQMGAGAAMKSALGYARGGFAGGGFPTPTGPATPERRTVHMPDHRRNRSAPTGMLAKLLAPFAEFNNINPLLQAANPYDLWGNALDNQYSIISSIIGETNADGTQHLLLYGSDGPPSDLALINQAPPSLPSVGGLSWPTFTDGTVGFDAETANQQMALLAMQIKKSVWEATIAHIHAAVSERVNRMALIQAYLKSENNRATEIKQALTNLRSTELQQRLRNAIDATKKGKRLEAARNMLAYLEGLKATWNAGRTRRISTARQSIAAVETLIHNELAKGPAADQSVLTSYNNQLGSLQSFVAGQAGPSPWDVSIRRERDAIRAIQAKKPDRVTPALEAIQRFDLENDLKPIQQAMSLLGGSSTHVGTGGYYGKLNSQVTQLNTAATTFQSDDNDLVTNIIPNIYLNMRAISQSKQSAIADGLLGGTPTPTVDNSATISAQQDLIQQLATQLFVSQAQYGVFAKAIGSFAVGTTNVPATGLALIHEGEAIIPKDLNPYTRPHTGDGVLGGTPQVHIYGLGDFVDRVDAIVAGRRQEITEYVNHDLAATSRARRILPGGPGSSALYNGR